MDLKSCLVLFCVVIASQTGANGARDRRQSRSGAPAQFTDAKIPSQHQQQQVVAQLIARGILPGPPLTFQIPQKYDRDSPGIALSQPIGRPLHLERSKAPQAVIQNVGPRAQLQQQQLQHQSQSGAPLRSEQPRGGRPLPNQKELLPLEEDDKDEELEKPDRLTELLPLSKFSCVGRATGYYADEGLDCEVFHYCQAGLKHSWICPEGFSFHQVHLICMPPGGDNICKKSSQFHFVNDYLYRPLNVEEVQNKPNVSLRYAERYYPDSYDGKRNEYIDEEQQEEKIPVIQPAIQQQQPRQQASFGHPLQQAIQQQQQPRQQASFGHPLQQAIQQQQQPRQQAPFGHPLQQAVPVLRPINNYQPRQNVRNLVLPSPQLVNIPIQLGAPGQQKKYSNEKLRQLDYDDQPYRQG